MIYKWRNWGKLFVSFGKKKKKSIFLVVPATCACDQSAYCFTGVKVIITLHNVSSNKERLCFTEVWYSHHVECYALPFCLFITFKQWSVFPHTIAAYTHNTSERNLYLLSFWEDKYYFPNFWVRIENITVKKAERNSMFCFTCTYKENFCDTG